MNRERYKEIMELCYREFPELTPLTETEIDRYHDKERACWTPHALMMERFKKYVTRNPAIVARVQKANPDGMSECGIFKGYHPHDRTKWLSWSSGMMVRDFIKEYGREAYRKLPKQALLRHGHRKIILKNYLPR